MVRRTKQNAADTAAVSSHLSDTSSLSSDPPGGGGSDNGSDDEDDDNRQRGVRPISKMPAKVSKQAAGAKSKTTSKSKLPAAAASKAKGNRAKNIPEKKSKDSRSKLKNSAGTDQQYCICRGGYNGKEFMVACDSCHEWFHGKCIGITEKDVPEHYFCTNCNIASDNDTEHDQAKKGKNNSKSKSKNVKAKPSKKKPTSTPEPPAVVKIASPKAEAIDVDMGDSDEDLDDICPVCDSVCTCGTKTKEDESNPSITVSSSLENSVLVQPELVHDTGVIEIIGEEPSTPKRSKAKSKAGERKGKGNKESADKHQEKTKNTKSKKNSKISSLDPHDITEEDDNGSIAENANYQSDISEEAFSHSSFLEGPVYSMSEGSVHIESGDDEDIEEEEERALIEQWELLQDQDELNSDSSEEAYDLDDEETMALMLEDQYETDEEMYTSDLLRHTNSWSSDEDDEEDFDEEQYNLDISDDNEIDGESIKDDEEDYDSDDDDDEDGVNMQFSPFFDESTDVSELLDNIAAALALSISLPGGPGEEAAADLTQQLQKALLEAGIDLSTIDENRSVASLLEQTDSSSKVDSATANDSDVDITGTPEDATPSSPTSPEAEESKISTNDASAALSQSLVNDLLLATGNSSSSDIKIEPEIMAAAVQDLVNAVTLTAAKQENDAANNGNRRLLEIIANSSQPSTSPGEVSNVDPMESTSTALKREAEEEIPNDRQQRARFTNSKDDNEHDGDKVADDQAVLIDDLVDTSRLYTRSTSRSPSPDPAESNRFSQDLSRWQRVPIGTFRRSRRISAPMIHASTALRSGNDEFASTLLSDLHAGPAANLVSGNSASTESDVAKKRRRSKHRGRSAAKSMSDLASIIQRSKDLLPSNPDSGGQTANSLGLPGLPSTNALAPSLSMAIASAVAAIRQSGSGQGGLRINRRQRRLSSLSSALDTDQPPSSACSSPLYSPLFSGIRHNDISVPELHLDEVVAELQKQEDREKSASQRKGRRPSKLSST